MGIILFINDKEQLIIPNDSIRIRIIANSNKEEDQKIKNDLKIDINKTVEKILENTKSLGEARIKLKNNLELITDTVEKSLKNDNFTVNYGLNFFPTKEFKGVKYDSGLYESLVITIGNGLGDNYWCVLYPPLCIADFNDNVEDYEYRSFIKDILDKYL